MSESKGETASRTIHEKRMSLREAAAHLQITERAVQMRAKAGTIQRVKEDSHVFYVLEIGEEPVQNLHEEKAKLREETEPSDLREVVEILREQLRVKDEQIKRRDEAEGELRRLMLADRQQIAELQQRLALAAAPQPAQDSASELSEGDTSSSSEKPAETGAQPGFWSRLFGRKA